MTISEVDVLEKCLSLPALAELARACPGSLPGRVKPPALDALSGEAVSTLVFENLIITLGRPLQTSPEALSKKAVSTLSLLAKGRLKYRTVPNA